MFTISIDSSEDRRKRKQLERLKNLRLSRRRESIYGSSLQLDHLSSLDEVDSDDGDACRYEETNEVSRRTRNATIKRIQYINFCSIIITLSIFSYIGEYLRLLTEQLFGQACHKENTVGWNAKYWAPCTTDPGTTDSYGGAMFIDIPANCLACFIIGLFVSGDSTLGVPVDLPVAFLPSSSNFQKWTITHMGIRTGLCGSLSTFASWNAQMVIMIVGGDGTELSSQWVSAIFGYLLGLMIALESFRYGRDVAIMLHRRNNPDLAKEADILIDRKELGFFIHRDLPDFERRFLHDILIDDELNNKAATYLISEKSSFSTVPEEDEEAKRNQKEAWCHGENEPLRKRKELGKSQEQPQQQSSTSLQNLLTDEEKVRLDHLHYLQKWKVQTKNNRYGTLLEGENSYRHELQEIEKAILIKDEDPQMEHLLVARDAGWDVNALKAYKAAISNSTPNQEKKNINIRHSFAWTSSFSTTARKSSSARPTALPTVNKVEMSVHASLWIISTGLLIWGSISMSGQNSVEQTYRSNFIAVLLSPFGTIVRWRLYRLNWHINHPSLAWLPIGTLMANMIASVISLFLAGVNLKIEPSSDNMLAKVFIEAIRSGFAGSLSTVSTFIVETSALLRELPRHAWGYYYSIGSLLLACILGVMSYVWAVV